MIHPDGAEAVTAYEHLRRHVVQRAPRGALAGVTLVVREGVAAWLDRGAPGGTAPSAMPDRTAPGPAVFLPLHAGIVDVLVSIALTTREEMYP